MTDHLTLLAFDFGMKRIGVAVGQTITKSANPLDTISATAGEPNWQTIDSLIQQWQPDACVVGIPLNMDGSEQPITQKAKHFAQQLAQHTSLTVHQAEERLTTKAARQQLFESGGYKQLTSAQVDSYAAKLILETWFKRGHPLAPGSQ